MKSFIKTKFFKALENRGQYYARVPAGVDRHCPICGYKGRFLPCGLYSVRPDAQCGGCGSLERHRLLFLFLKEEQPFDEQSKVLHFAPEQALQGVLKKIIGSYVTADLVRTDVDHQWNIEDIDCPDDTFDGIVCNHVLEHVDADKALRECRRILKPGAVGLFMFPINEGLDTTYENPKIKTDQDRWKHFQQSDHVRIFGRDVRGRFRSAGFDLDEYTFRSEDAADFSLILGERIFIARKPV